MYSSLAPYYDLLMRDTDYGKITGYLEDIFNKEKNIKTVADIGCGTGKVAIALAKDGYSVIGVDISGDMLAFARQKALESNVSLPLVMQNMTELNLGGNYDAVICCLDGINYVKPSKLKKCFLSVYDNLADGGLFVFDVNSLEKFENIYGQNDYVLEENGVL